MKYSTLLFILAVCVISMTSAAAQAPTPAAEQTAPVAIMNATAHLGNGNVIENSIVTFANGNCSVHEKDYDSAKNSRLHSPFHARKLY